LKWPVAAPPKAAPCGGPYVPEPLGIRADRADATAKAIATETLSLKLNWNNTQFDGYLPINVRAVKQMGHILKYVGDGEPVEPRYANYT
jgi:hypothetical protein